MSEPTSSGMRVEVHRDIDSIGRARWETLVHPSFYLSYDWLRARSSMIRGQPRFFVVVDASGTPLVAAPAYVTDHASHPGYDVARVLEMDDLEAPAIAELPADEASVVARLRARIASKPEALR